MSGEYWVKLHREQEEQGTDPGEQAQRVRPGGEYDRPAHLTVILETMYEMNTTLCSRISALECVAHAVLGPVPTCTEGPSENTTASGGLIEQILGSLDDFGKSLAYLTAVTERLERIG